MTWNDRTAITMIAILLVGAAGHVYADKKTSATLKNSQSKEDLKSAEAIKKQYSKISQAILTKNIKSLQAISTPDYTLSTPSGQVVTRQQMERQISMSLSFLQKITKASSVPSNIKVKGNEAKMDVAETVEGVFPDPETQGKVRLMGTTNRYHDTWVKTGNTWLRKHSDVIKIATTMDGKPFDLQSAFGGASGSGGIAPAPKK